MPNIVQRLLLRASGVRNVRPATVPTYGLRAGGIPVYEADLPEGVEAMVHPVLRGVVVRRGRGLTPETAVHELVHVRQMRDLGPLAFVEVLRQVVQATREGKNPAMAIPLEVEAYEAQDRARRRVEAQADDRRRLYAEQRAKADAFRRSLPPRPTRTGEPIDPLWLVPLPPPRYPE